MDTLTLVTYNLENFGAPGINCTPLDTATRKAYNQTILDFVKPDILGICEINNRDAVVNYYLKNVLNRNGNTFERVNLSSETGDIVNMHYYNSKKLGVKLQSNITSTTRHVKVTQFYYKDPNFPQTTDTTFIFCLQAHLKAGNTTSDANTRYTESINITNYLSSFGFAGNFILMGDLNLYTNAETAYTNLTNNFNNSIRFYDPVKRSGVWSNNSAFADVHTQCPTTSTANCLSGGGLDDRFDFILATNIIVSTTVSNNFKYVPNSYRTIGNDGLHFNQSVTAGVTNNSAPNDVLIALRTNSDHLPVSAKFSIRQSIPTAIQNSLNSKGIERLNVVKSGDNFVIQFYLSNSEVQDVNISIFSTLGVQTFSSLENIHSGANEIFIPENNFSEGMNIIGIRSKYGFNQLKTIK